MTTANEVTEPAPFSLEVEMVEGEPRVLDTALAKQLGMAQPADVRRTIKANAEELQSFGLIAARAINGGGRSAPGRAFT